MAQKPMFSLVTATVNERQELINTISAIHDTCDSEDIGEFIVVYSNSCPEDYPEFLEGIRSIFSDINFVFHRQTGKGIHNAVFESYSLARYPNIIGFAADGNNAPEEICGIMELAKRNPDTIITASRRLHKHGFDNYPMNKRIVNDLFYLMLKFVCRVKQSDITYFFQCTPKSIFTKYCNKENEDIVMTFICLIPEIYGEKFIEFPSVLKSDTEKKRTKLRTGYYFRTVITILTMLKKHKKKGRKK